MSCVLYAGVCAPFADRLATARVRLSAATLSRLRTEMGWYQFTGHIETCIQHTVHPLPVCCLYSLVHLGSALDKHISVAAVSTGRDELAVSQSNYATNGSDCN